MPRGIGEHPLEQLALAGLGLGALRELVLDLANAQRQRVADPLELSDLEHPWTADGADPPFDPLAGKALREQLAEPPLQPRDLATQLGAGTAFGRGIGGGSRARRRGSSPGGERWGHESPSALPAGSV